jgi:hypothetical protein
MSDQDSKQSPPVGETEQLDGKMLLPVAPDPKDLCSVRLRHFFVRHREIFEFFFFAAALASRADDARRTAIEALAKVGRQEDLDRLEQVKVNPTPFSKRLRTFGWLLSENICIRSTDNFLTFVSEVIQTAIAKRPELLRSDEMVRVDDVLRFSNYNDLTAVYH